MTAITINQYRRIDVKFPFLNDLANRLRVADARITVRKLGKLHRIILVEKPTIASVEQILSSAGTEQNYLGVAAAQTSNTTEAIALSNELSVTKTSTTAQHQDLPELASLDELNALSQKKLNQLAATNKIVWWDLELWGNITQVATDWVRKGSTISVAGELKFDVWVDKNSGLPRIKPVIRVSELELISSSKRSEEPNTSSNTPEPSIANANF